MKRDLVISRCCVWNFGSANSIFVASYIIELDSCPHTVLSPVVYVAVSISGSKEGDNCRPAILNLLEENIQFQWLIYWERASQYL